jgi:hypothetical protein
VCADFGKIKKRFELNVHLNKCYVYEKKAEDSGHGVDKLQLKNLEIE